MSDTEPTEKSAADPVHLTLTLSVRQRQRLNQNETIILYPDEADFKLHIGKYADPDHATDDTAWVEISDHKVDELNKGQVARLVTPADARLSTVVLEPSRVDQRL